MIRQRQTVRYLERQGASWWAARILGWRVSSSVADPLRGDHKQSEYGKVILPFTVSRRLDCVLAPTKQQVLDCKAKLEQ